MELIWLVLALLAVDLAALLFGADTRPGFQHSSHRVVPHLSRRGLPSSRWVAAGSSRQDSPSSGWAVPRRSGRRANGG
jgi:hypothetical protein